jgi:DNA-binding response OmpR family regulator
MAELDGASRNGAAPPEARAAAALRFSDLEINLETRVATRGQRRISLSAREYDLLVALVRNPNRVFSRDQLLDQVWGTERFVGPGAVETYISYLRAKIDHGFAKRLIHTHRGVGYSLREE